MTEDFALLWSAIAGALLGTFFFGGLWWTVRRGVVSPNPALWFSGSLMLRMSLTLAGFYVVGRDHGDRMALCLVGFVIARIGVTWATNRMPEPDDISAAGRRPEVLHAH